MILFLSTFYSVRTDLMENGANSTLSIAKVRKTDSGKYSCSVGPNDSHTINVQVLNGNSILLYFTFNSKSFKGRLLLLLLIDVNCHCMPLKIVFFFFFCEKCAELAQTDLIYFQAKVLLNSTMVALCHRMSNIRYTNGLHFSFPHL